MTGETRRDGAFVRFHLIANRCSVQADARPDITHQCLMNILDSPLNKAGLVQVLFYFLHSFVLLPGVPGALLTRVVSRSLCGVGRCTSTPIKMCSSKSTRASASRVPSAASQAPKHTLITPFLHCRRPAVVNRCFMGGLMVQLLHKLSIRATNGPEKLLQVPHVTHLTFLHLITPSSPRWFKTPSQTTCL